MLQNTRIQSFTAKVRAMTINFYTSDHMKLLGTRADAPAWQAFDLSATFHNLHLKEWDALPKNTREFSKFSRAFIQAQTLNYLTKHSSLKPKSALLFSADAHYPKISRKSPRLRLQALNPAIFPLRRMIAFMQLRPW